MKHSKSRRGRGEGSIGQLPSGLWYAEASAGFDNSGKRIRKRVYGATKLDVQRELRKLQEKADRGLLKRDSSNLDLSSFLLQWLSSIQPTIAPTSHRSYKRDVNLYIKPTIGAVKLSKLGVHHVKVMYTRLAEMKKSAAMQRKAGITLGVALQVAVNEGLLPFNPARMTKKPMHKPKEIRPLDADQVQVFLKAAEPDRMYALYVVAIDSGAREGELFALQWRDVDFAAKAISITKTLQELDATLVVKETKTPKSKRRLPLSDFAFEVLQDHRKRMLAESHYQPDAFVFCTAEGKPWFRSPLHRKSFKPILKNAGLPPIRFYDLRHTSATLLLLAGEPAKVASERLGHSSIVLTLDTYSHVSEGMQKQATEKLDTFLRPRKTITE